MPFWYLGFHGNAILNLINTPKIPHTTVNIPTMFHERNQILFKSTLFFISMATAAKFVLPIPTFLAYLIPLDVDVTGKASPRNRADKNVWKNKNNKNKNNSEKET